MKLVGSPVAHRALSATCPGPLRLSGFAPSAVTVHPVGGAAVPATLTATDTVLPEPEALAGVTVNVCVEPTCTCPPAAVLGRPAFGLQAKLVGLPAVHCALSVTCLGALRSSGLAPSAVTVHPDGGAAGPATLTTTDTVVRARSVGGVTVNAASS
jgi:hypothetical protein